MKKNKIEIKKIDQVGRVSMTKEIIEKLKLNEKDEMDIYDDGNKIYIERYSENNELKGIKRRIDELKRIVVPPENRLKLNIQENNKILIYMDEDKIVLEKYYKHI